MAARAHGRNGLLKVDVTEGALGLAVTTIPNLADWSIEGSADRVDVTCMQDGNKVELLGFNSFKLTVSGFADPATDVFRIIGDGVPRAFVFQEDTTAAVSRWYHGMLSLDFSTSGGASKAIAVTLTGGAAGTIVKTFDADAPAFP